MTPELIAQIGMALFLAGVILLVVSIREGW